MYNKRHFPILLQHVTSSPDQGIKLRTRLLVGVLSSVIGFTPFSASFAQRKNVPNPNSSASLVMQAPAQDISPRFVDPKNPQAMDLIKLFQEAAQYDPTFLSAKNAYIAGK